MRHTWIVVGHAQSFTFARLRMAALHLYELWPRQVAAAHVSKAFGALVCGQGSPVLDTQRLPPVPELASISRRDFC